MVEPPETSSALPAGVVVAQGYSVPVDLSGTARTLRWTGRAGARERLICHGGRDWGRDVVEDDGVFLEGALGGVCPGFLRAHGVPEDTVIHREPGDTGSDLDHLIREIGAEDEREPSIGS